MPHLILYAHEPDLATKEAALIAALTDAIVEVYGEWARADAVVQLVGLAPGRWGIGGAPAKNPAPRVTFGIRDGVFARPDGPEILAALARNVTDAIASVLGEKHRAGTTIEFVGAPDGRTAVAGALVSP
ncbi:tautomerase family protein [Cryptosporangium phraense]|uniref:4-oxalocrotonate tautomerase-like domain-containing protein n=1 Tax=Cryptosporangium phraense TaxID=2593070 RepID=A0A545AJ35_9ACTN|nr:tautomerase family protein [Cryptosporangium phraense]TQS41337.1 hypothetical protein FL583_29955 [Cryptosporangium phraense]